MELVDRNYPWTILILDDDTTRSQQVREKVIQTWPKSRIDVKHHQDLNIDWGNIEAVISFSEFEPIISWIRNATLIPVLVYSDSSTLDLSHLLVKKSCFHQFHNAFSTLLNSSFSISFT
jgi:hypothetical protein